MILENLRNKKILLVGYGADGQATEAYLRAHIPTVNLTIADQKGDPTYLESQHNFDSAIVSPGVPKHLITIPYETSTNIFFENCRGTVIGITGTKGKSTTAKILYEILDASGREAVLLGNFGTPLLAGLQENNNEQTFFVTEFSSYQLENCRYSPVIAVVTALFPDHVPHHGSLENYYKAKQNIAAYQTEKDHVIFPTGNPIIAGWHMKAQKHAVNGSYETLNKALAAEVAELLGVDRATIDNAVNAYRPLPHRLEYIGEYRGITFYDDGAGTIPEATIEAIRTTHPATLLVGGHNRGYDFSHLAGVIASSGIKNLVFFPDTGDKIKRELDSIKYQYASFQTSSMEEAVRFAYENTPKGTVCLLSTASTSYNLWKNFSEKGDEFQKWVKELGVA